MQLLFFYPRPAFYFFFLFIIPGLPSTGSSLTKKFETAACSTRFLYKPQQVKSAGINCLQKGFVRFQKNETCPVK